jgi:hypothetical protein
MPSRWFRRVTLGLICLAIGLWGELPADWARVGAEPYRQTVPLTPPATWTPVPVPTAAVPPTRGSQPSSTPVGSTETPLPPSVTLAATGTPSPPSATADRSLESSRTVQPTQAESAVSATWTLTPPPVLQLSWVVEPEVVGPGSDVVLQLVLMNTGSGALPGARIVVERPTFLYSLAWHTPVGQLWDDPEGIVWEPGELEAGEEIALALQAQVVEDLLPGASLPLQALLIVGDAPQRVEGGLTAPPALLPDCGRLP